MFPAGTNPLYLEDGSVCYHEHTAQLLPADRDYVFCGCRLSDGPNNTKVVTCGRTPGLDFDPNNNNRGT